MAQELGKIPPTVPVYNKWEIDAELAKKVDTVNNVAPVKGNVDLSTVISNSSGLQGTIRLPRRDRGVE